jgi:hypothetical protein
VHLAGFSVARWICRRVIGIRPPPPVPGARQGLPVLHACERCISASGFDMDLVEAQLFLADGLFSPLANS